MKSRIVTASIYLARALIPLLRLLPPTLAVKLSGAVARVLARFFPREQRIAAAQLEFALGGTAASRSEIFKGCFEHLGVTFAELINSDKLLPSRIGNVSGIHYQSTEYLSCPKAANDPVLRNCRDGNAGMVLASHFGNFELQAAYYAHCGLPLYVIGRKPNYPALAELVDQIRRKHLLTTIWREDSSSARKLIKALKTGSTIAALIDQDIHLENGYAPFFGLDAASPIAPIRLAVKQRVPIIFSSIERVSPLKHEMVSSMIHYDETASVEDAVQQVLRGYNAELEALIRRHPEHWPWWHRRWRRRPGIDYSKSPELLRSTEEYVSWIKQLDSQSAANEARA